MAKKDPKASLPPMQTALISRLRAILMQSRRLRIRLLWLLVFPYLWLTTPTPALLALGSALAVAGLALRAWAAGTILKNSRLVMTGPYAYLRNPLYAGSLLAAGGLAAAGGHWAWPVAAAFLYVCLYAPTMAHEETELERRFGDSFRRYRSNVPALVPRRTPYRPDEPRAGDGFRWARYWRHREWQSLLALAAVFAVLTAKTV